MTTILAKSRNFLTCHFTATFGAVLLLQASCSSPRPITAVKAPGQLVNITVSGEVSKRGIVAIKSDFTKEAFLDAVSGFTYGSNMGATPTRFILKRRANAKALEWKIKFAEMPAYRAKGFAFENGDVVVVSRLFW